MASPSRPLTNAGRRPSGGLRGWWQALRQGDFVPSGHLKWRQQVIFWLWSSLPFILLAWLVWRAGYIGDTRARLVTQALVVRRVGIGDNFPELFPPLPFLTASIAPNVLVLGVLSALATGGIVWGIWQYLIPVPIPMRTRWLLLIAFIMTPSVLTLSVTSYGEMMALCLHVLSWLSFQAFMREGQTWNAFLAGLILGVAFYFNAIAVLFLFLFVAALVNYLRLHPDPDHHDTGRMWAAIMVLVFPIVAAMFIWLFLYWVYAGNVFAMRNSFATVALNERLLTAIPQTVGEFVSLPVLIAVAFVTSLRNPRALVVVLMPVIAVLIARLLGFDFPAAFAQGLYLVTGLVSISRAIPSHRVPVLTIAAVAQIIISGAFLWFELQAEPNIYQLLTPEANQHPENAILFWLEDAPSGSVLADDEAAYRFIALNGSARPFIVPDDALYPLAAYDPRSYVSFILMAAPTEAVPTDAVGAYVWQQDDVAVRYSDGVPAGFVLVEAIDGWNLYQNQARP